MHNRTMTERCEPFRKALGAPNAFASIVPDRSPEVKLHSSLGRARSAVAYSRYRVRGGEIHQLIDGEWKLIETVERGTDKEDLPWQVSA